MRDITSRRQWPLTHLPVARRTVRRTVFGVVVDITFRLHDVSKFLGSHIVIIDDLNGTNFK